MIEKMIKNIIAREGGYVDHPSDRGGATKYGITSKALINYLGRSVDKEDIKNVSKNDAYEIYYLQYFKTPKIDEIPVSLQEKILDMSVNHGPTRAIKILQRVIVKQGMSIAVDGIIGTKTLGALDNVTLEKGDTTILNSLVDERVWFYERIVKHDETQRVFLAGWVSRAESFRHRCLA